MGYILTHYILVVSPTVIYWTRPFVILGVLDVLYRFYSIFDGNSCWQTVKTQIRRHIMANSVDPGQTPHYGKQCRPRTDATLWQTV